MRSGGGFVRIPNECSMGEARLHGENRDPLVGRIVSDRRGASALASVVLSAKPNEPRGRLDESIPGTGMRLSVGVGAASRPLGRCLSVLMVGAAMVRGASAEERTGQLFVTGGLTLPQQSGLSGETYQTYLRAPGGRTRGWVLGGGIFVAHAASLELELSTTGVMTAREATRYDTTVNEERQDRGATLAVRFHLRPNRVVDIEPVVGIALVGGRAWSQAESYNHSNPQQLLTVYPKQRSDLPIRVGLTAGLDLRLGTGRFACVPSFRVQAARTGAATQKYPGGGFPVWTFRPGVTVRFAF